MTLPFPAALAAAMRERRLTQAELARRVGCGRASIGEYLSGAAVPRRERLQKINEVLGARLVVSQKISIREVAAAMGIGINAVRRGLRDGTLSQIGGVIKAKSGNAGRYFFYPAKVREFLGVS